MLALIFPGQGSQAVGMGQTIYGFVDKFVGAQCFCTKQKFFDILGYDLFGVMFNGPAEKLNQTIYTQPAVLTASIMIWNYMKSFEQFNRLNIACVAGHSIGEYAALVASGCITLEDALRLIKVRAAAMAEASPSDGAMCAILGSDEETLRRVILQVCSEDKKLCAIANYNCPGQIVISGIRAYVEKVRDAAIAMGAKKGVMLSVSGPFHSPWMQPASERLEEAVSDVDFSPTQIPVVSNVTGNVANDWQTLLPLQVKSPVLWNASIQAMVNLGVNVFVEVGNGNVLSGISKRCAPDKTFISLQTFDDVTHFMKNAG
jgi:[acyl-carrier-protein] S-malonyltransferase